MSIAARAAKSLTISFDPSVPAERSILREAAEGISSIYTGRAVTVDKALGFVPVMAAIRVISETVASLPLQVFERLERGKRVAPDHRLYEMLHDQANPEMTSFVWREVSQSHIESWGNAYSEIEFDTQGFPLYLWPLRPDRMEVFRENRKLVYVYTTPDGKRNRLSRRQMFHVPGLGFDGRIGYSPLHMARQAIALGMATEEFAARFYSNDARPGLAIKLGPEYDYDDDAKKRLAESFDATHAGLTNKHRTAVLDEGMGLEQIGWPPELGKLVGESQKWSIPTTSRIFNLSPHMLHDLERATFSNIEEQGINVTTYQFRPRLVRWEQQFKMQLLAGDRRHFAEFNVDGLLRGKLEDRMKAYWQMFQMAAISPNEIRALENRNPIEGGDVYYHPVNIAPLEAAQAVDFPPLQLIASRSAKSLEDRRRLAAEFAPLFEDVTRTVVEFERERVLAEAQRRLTSSA
ncbi:MAG: phage portal protein [Chloroflexi bacterium]|nr:phage portal protein [Chloroflexota bacterium]